jgi:hypothetical protein
MLYQHLFFKGNLHLHLFKINIMIPHWSMLNNYLKHLLEQNQII